jgi:transposase-like protein
MIEPDVRNAIYQLHQQGMSLREISRCLHISRNAVRRIVKQQGKSLVGSGATRAD